MVILDKNGCGQYARSRKEPPWKLHPYRLTSWWEVENFSAALFMVISDSLATIGRIAEECPPDQVVPKDVREVTAARMISLEMDCTEVGLRFSAKYAFELGERFRQEDVTCGEVHRELSILQKRIQDEMLDDQFFYMPAHEAGYYSKPFDGWEQIIQRFPKVEIDVQESSKCFACGRYAASIFHILLVAEYGVIEVGKLLKVEGDRPGWSCLERVEKILEKKFHDRSDLEKQHTKFIENTLPLMMAIKDSWRHKISHVDNRLVWLDADFSPELAEEIRMATRGLMRRLALDLPVPA